MRLSEHLEPALFDQVFGPVNQTTQTYTRVWLVACEGHFLVFASNAARPLVALFFVRDLVVAAAATGGRKAAMVFASAVLARVEDCSFFLEADPAPQVRTDLLWDDLEAVALAARPGTLLVRAEVAEQVPGLGPAQGGFVEVSLSTLVSKDDYVLKLAQPPR
jgi:hypothetical protein